MAVTTRRTSREKTNAINFLVRVVQGLLVPCILILTWELAVRLNFLPSTLIASPSQVISKVLLLILNGQLLMHAYASSSRLLLGFIGGTTLGILFGTVVSFSQLGARLFEPSILTLMPIPAIAWIPLLIVLFGIDDGSKIVLIGIGNFFILFLSTSTGIRGTNQELVEVAQVLEKSRWSLLRQVLLPSAFPSILESLRLAMALSWTLLMASEIIASSSGLGWLMWDARNFSRPDDLFAGMVSVGILGKLTDSLVVNTEKYLTRWRRTYRGGNNV